MSSSHVWSAYSARAKEYAAALGHMEATSQEDRQLIARWARGVQGRIVDLGCGPGHWTAYLHDLGLEVEGVDPVEGFIEIARTQHPYVTYRQGSSACLPARSYGAVLAWYSLIHIPPQDLPGALASLRDSLTPRGSLLIGFFAGDRAEEFPHAVTPAYYWPPQELASLLERSGFIVLDMERRQVSGVRDHGSISCRVL
ncbi:class I SAM-dependent methyltransferase [Actinomyces oris]|uniref:class I SAM-dependent methyltransferase n=1 Tax=Actinomyces oris TaxID=544580 RepID=UPI0028E94717|nr:class I SAM-dependent methyltransferase [Actinomyces oris]